MAVSYVKKNKALFSRVKKELSKAYRRDIDHYVYMDIYGKHKSFNVEFDLPLKDIKIIEEKDKVYAGIDLAIMKPIPKDIKWVAYSLIKDMAFPYYKSDVVDDVVGDLRDEGLVDGSGAKACSDDELLNSKTVANVANIIEEKLDTGFICELKEGEWPRLQDRSILPLLIFDKSSDTVDFHEGRKTAYSYREGRQKVIVPNIEYAFDQAKNYRTFIPHNLITIREK